MKEVSAVEWLENQIKTSKHYFKLMAEIKNRSTIAQSNIFEQAKEMEKKQGYSEKEVIELLTKRSKHFGTSLKPFDKILLKQDLEWFQQYKKK